MDSGRQSLRPGDHAEQFGQLSPLPGRQAGGGLLLVLPGRPADLAQERLAGRVRCRACSRRRRSYGAAQSRRAAPGRRRRPPTQDAQRFDATRKKITTEHHRLLLRALSEADGHFLLGPRTARGNPAADWPARSAGRPRGSGDQAEGGLRSRVGRQEGMAVAQRVERGPGQGRERVCRRAPGADLGRGLGAGSRPALCRPRLPAGHGLPPDPPAASPARVATVRRRAGRRQHRHDRSPRSASPMYLACTVGGPRASRQRGPSPLAAQSGRRHAA
jgi:hypothetical protein